MSTLHSAHFSVSYLKSFAYILVPVVLTSNIRCADWYVLSCRRIVDSGDDSILSHIISEFEQRVTELNTQKCDELRPHLHSAVDHVIQTVSYRFLADHGPKLGRVTNSEPLVHQ